ncbi:MAG: zinc-binding dehydrogenase [Chloroflexi bacterium]|nr:zinc-binding dehydrogenase [Chloroflexota bacterium]
MFAARIVGPKEYEHVQLPIPDIENAPKGMILVKTRRATICGSDMPYYLGVHPLTMHRAKECFSAHETVGEVVASNSSRFTAGDVVMSEPYMFKGLGQYFLADESRTALIPNDGEWNKWTLAQPLGTVIWGMRKVGALFHQDVVVLGQGGIGLFAMQMAANLGARNIIAVDKHALRRTVSANTGATHTLPAMDDDALAAAVNEITGGRGPDLVIEAVGHQTDTLNTAIKLARYGGSILAFGVPDIEEYPVLYNELFRKNVRLMPTVSSPDYPRDFELAVQYIKNGRIRVDGIVTHELPFSRLKEAFDLFADRKDEAIKVMINYEQ